MSSPPFMNPDWLAKQIQLDDIPEKIPNGSSVYIGSTAATTYASLRAMVDDYQLQNIQILQLIPGGNLPHLSRNIDRFQTVSFYSFNKGLYFTSENNTQEGLQDYKPVSISAIPRLLAEHRMSVDVAIIKVTPPHKGFCSLGMGVDCTKDFVKHARIVIAEVNKNMPWTEGPSKIPVSDITWWVSEDGPLLTTRELWPDFFKLKQQPDDVMSRMGENVVKEIRDGDCLRFGVSSYCYSVFPFLRQRKDLGLHTDVLTETLFRLHEEGVFTNARKNIGEGRTIVSQAHGSQDLYQFLDRNPIIEFHPSSYTCSPQILGQIDNLVSVVGALKIDLTGQIATDSIAHKFYGGVWSDNDSIQGARFSKGGKPIVVLPSKSLHGRSNVVFALPPGTGVCITRADVEYVVTEYGTANLYGRSIRERCLALIDIAHPDFRESLLREAKEHRYLSQSQPGRPFGSVYPSEFECTFQTKSKKEVFVRPIKAVDEDILRNFFHKLSDHSVYLRYFRRLKSMPQRILQRTTDVDYSSDMAIVALNPPDPFRHELVGIAQWVHDPRGGNPEMAFQVRDDWQGEGLGSFLFRKLVRTARALGVSELKADVLSDNKGMNQIFQRSGVRYVTRSDFGVTTYTFFLESESEGNPASPEDIEEPSAIVAE